MNMKTAVLCLLVFGLSPVTAAFSQSLAAVAQLQEERRKAVATPAKIYTNADVDSGREVLLPPPTAAAAEKEVAREPGSGDYSPARYLGGAVPPLPLMALGGGQVLLELAIGADGRVATVRLLRATPPFTDLLVSAVGSWVFFPAERIIKPKPGEAVDPKARERVESKVLVAAQFRPPALYKGTLGEPPREVGSGSPEAPFPTATIEPLHPLSAVNPGVVLVEAAVDAQGAVAETKVIQSAPAFNDVAQAAARQWRFRPARIDGQSVKTLAYIVFGFPVPVAAAPSTNPIGQSPAEPAQSPAPTSPTGVPGR